MKNAKIVFVIVSSLALHAISVLSCSPANPPPVGYPNKVTRTTTSTTTSGTTSSTETSTATDATSTTSATDTTPTSTETMSTSTTTATSTSTETMSTDTASTSTETASTSTDTASTLTETASTSTDTESTSTETASTSTDTASTGTSTETTPTESTTTTRTTRFTTTTVTGSTTTAGPSYKYCYDQAIPDYLDICPAVADCIQETASCSAGKTELYITDNTVRLFASEESCQNVLTAGIWFLCDNVFCRPQGAEFDPSGKISPCINTTEGVEAFEADSDHIFSNLVDCQVAAGITPCA